jgi:hypothetical protein
MVPDITDKVKLTSGSFSVATFECLRNSLMRKRKIDLTGGALRINHIV